MNDGLLNTILTGCFGLAGTLLLVFGTIVAAGINKGSGNKLDLSSTVWVGIGGMLAIVGCIGGILIGYSIFGNTPDPTEQVTFNNNPSSSAESNQSSLIINGVSYSLPDSSSSPHCVAQEVHTNGSNVVTYNVTVPSGWVMMWSSWKANWEGGSYNQDGMLIIKGPYSGTIEINTGGSCSGPIEWYDFIHQNRINDYSVPSRPEYTIP